MDTTRAKTYVGSWVRRMEARIDGEIDTIQAAGTSFVAWTNMQQEEKFDLQKVVIDFALKAAFAAAPDFLIVPDFLKKTVKQKITPPYRKLLLYVGQQAVDLGGEVHGSATKEPTFTKTVNTGAAFLDSYLKSALATLQKAKWESIKTAESLEYYLDSVKLGEATLNTKFRSYVSPMALVQDILGPLPPDVSMKFDKLMCSIQYHLMRAYVAQHVTVYDNVTEVDGSSFKSKGGVTGINGAQEAEIYRRYGDASDVGKDYYSSVVKVLGTHAKSLVVGTSQMSAKQWSANRVALSLPPVNNQRDLTKVWGARYTTRVNRLQRPGNARAA